MHAMKWNKTKLDSERVPVRDRRRRISTQGHTAQVPLSFRPEQYRIHKLSSQTPAGRYNLFDIRSFVMCIRDVARFYRLGSCQLGFRGHLLFRSSRLAPDVRSNPTGDSFIVHRLSLPPTGRLEVFVTSQSSVPQRSTSPGPKSVDTYLYSSIGKAIGAGDSCEVIPILQSRSGNASGPPRCLKGNDLTSNS